LLRADKPPAPIELDEAARLCADDANLLWADLVEPTDDEWQRVREALDLDPRAVGITRRLNPRPTMRVYPEQFLMTVLVIDSEPGEQGPRPGTVRFSAIELDMIVGRNFLVSAHKRPLPFAEQLDARTATNPDLGRFDASYLLHVMLDTLLDDYADEFERLEDRVGRLEEELLRESGRGSLDDALALKRQVHKVRRIVAPHRAALSTLTAPDSPIHVREDVDVVAFRDLLARLDGLVAHLDHIRDLALGSYNLYISNVSHRTNQQLKVLTILSAVLLPLTLISGLYGTNFKLSEYDSPDGFYVMLVGMTLMVVGMLVFFRWKRWI
jgi:magnesium transporter